MFLFIDYVLSLANRLGHWGYLVIFLVVMLECQALLGLFIPGESIVLLSGFLAGQHLFDLDAVVVTVAVAGIVGDNVGYQLGKRLGRSWLLRHGRWFGVTQMRLEKTASFIRRHGGESAFFSHFMHMLRPLMPFTSGMSHMPYWRFVSWNAAGCTLWAGTFTLLGYFFGHSWKQLEKWVGRAGALVGGLLLLTMMVLWLWNWLSRHEVEFLAQGCAFLEMPRVAALRRRFAPYIRFLQNRLTPGGYLGIHLTLGVVVIIAGAWCFGGILQDLLAHDPLSVVDLQVAIWFTNHAVPTATDTAHVVTVFGSPAFLAGATGALALALGWRRSWYRLLALVMTMGGGSLLHLLLKSIFHISTPAFISAPQLAAEPGFPSAYTMGATLLYLFGAVNVAVSIREWRWRVLAVLMGFFVVVLIGLTRVYLMKNYLSDVLGAIAAGVAWLASCLTAVETLRRYRL